MLNNSNFAWNAKPTWCYSSIATLSPSGDSYYKKNSYITTISSSDSSAHPTSGMENDLWYVIRTEAP